MLALAVIGCCAERFYRDGEGRHPLRGVAEDAVLEVQLLPEGYHAAGTQNPPYFSTGAPYIDGDVSATCKI